MTNDHQPIQTALLSFGMSGRVFHAPFINLHTGFSLSGIWERTKQDSLQFYPDIHIYRTLEEVLNDEAIELVIVNTPTNTHYEFTKKVLAAGKHAVVEKAFTTTVEEAIELQALAKEKNKLVSVFQNRRWDSDFSTVRKVVQDGLIGDVVEAEFHFDRFNENLSPKLHKEIPGPGAGILNDLGPHLIDQALYLFGKPSAVFGDVRTLRPISAVDDCFTIQLFYADKRVTLKSSMLVKEPLPSFIVHGTKGSFIKTRADVQETQLLANQKPNLTNWGIEPESERGLLHTVDNGVITRERIPTLQGNYYHYYDGVHKALVNNTAAPVTTEDGIEVMRIIEAVRRSSSTGTIIACL